VGGGGGGFPQRMGGYERSPDLEMWIIAAPVHAPNTTGQWQWQCQIVDGKASTSTSTMHMHHAEC
jgi:hypothetical protein